MLMLRVSLLLFMVSLLFEGFIVCQISVVATRNMSLPVRSMLLLVQVWDYCVTTLRTLIHYSKGLRRTYSVVRCLTMPFLVGHLLITLVNILRFILNSLSCFTSYYKCLTLSYITLSNPILQTCELNFTKPCLQDVVPFFGVLEGV